MILTNTNLTKSTRQWRVSCHSVCFVTDDLMVSREIEVFQVALRWIIHGAHTRIKHVTRVLRLIRSVPKTLLIINYYLAPKFLSRELIFYTCMNFNRCTF